MSRKQRNKECVPRLLCKLKAGVFPIKLETERYNGSKREDRIHELCTKGMVEDKIQFVFKCKAFKPIRKPYVKLFYDEHGGKHRFKDKFELLKCMLLADNIKEFSDF